jgi:hypothetical protein
MVVPVVDHESMFVTAIEPSIRDERFDEFGRALYRPIATFRDPGIIVSADVTARSVLTREIEKQIEYPDRFTARDTERSRESSGFGVRVSRPFHAASPGSSVGISIGVRGRPTVDQSRYSAWWPAMARSPRHSLSSPESTSLRASVPVDTPFSIAISSSTAASMSRYMALIFAMRLSVIGFCGAPTRRLGLPVSMGTSTAAESNPRPSESQENYAPHQQKIMLDSAKIRLYIGQVESEPETPDASPRGQRRME